MKLGVDLQHITMSSNILRNRCQCSLCGDIIESKYTTHFVSCDCGCVYTEGGREYICRWALEPQYIIELDEYGV